MRRNQIAELSENTEFGRGWFGISFFSPLLSGRVKEPFQPLFFTIFPQGVKMALGMLN
jgi:hypothetical protein